MAQGSTADRGWAWVILFAAFFCNVTFDGIIFSFGMFYLEFLEYFKQGRGVTSWIGSVISGVYAIVGKSLDKPLNNCDNSTINMAVPGEVEAKAENHRVEQ